MDAKEIVTPKKISTLANRIIILSELLQSMLSDLTDLYDEFVESCDESDLAIYSEHVFNLEQELIRGNSKLQTIKERADKDMERGMTIYAPKEMRELTHKEMMNMTEKDMPY